MQALDRRILNLSSVVSVPSLSAQRERFVTATVAMANSLNAQSRIKLVNSHCLRARVLREWSASGAGVSRARGTSEAGESAG